VPSKTTKKLFFDVFEGPPSGEFQKIWPPGDDLSPGQAKPSKTSKTLDDLDPGTVGVPYAQWKADQLSAIFAQHVLGVPGRICRLNG
jgi:hypothetical protein